MDYKISVFCNLPSGFDADSKYQPVKKWHLREEKPEQQIKSKAMADVREGIGVKKPLGIELALNVARPEARFAGRAEWRASHEKQSDNGNGNDNRNRVSSVFAIIQERFYVISHLKKIISFYIGCIT